MDWSNILISVSTEHPKRHTVLKFDVETRTARRIFHGQGPLVAPVLADANGYSLYVLGNDEIIHGERYLRLHDANAVESDDTDNAAADDMDSLL